MGAGIALVRIRLRPGKATEQRHRNIENEAGAGPVVGLARAFIRVVDSLGDPDFIPVLVHREGILEIPEGILPRRSVPGPAGHGGIHMKQAGPSRPGKRQEP